MLREPLRAFGQHVILATDIVERAHAAVRQDLLSATRARTADDARKRVFCRQVRTEHMKRGGADPALKQAFVETRSSPAPGGERQNMHPGSVQLRHRNHKMKAWKGSNAPRRPMAPTEIDAVRQDAADEWDRMSPEELPHWTNLNATRSRSSKAARRSSARGVLPDEQGWQEFKGLWTDHADPSLVFPAEDTQALAPRAGDAGASAGPAGAPSLVDMSLSRPGVVSAAAKVGVRSGAARAE